MNVKPVVALIATLAGAAIACSAAAEAEPSAPEPPAPKATIEADAEAPDGDASLPLPEACSKPAPPPQCTSLDAAPTDRAAVTEAVRQSAIALRCASEAGAVAWDFRPLIDAYGAQKMFMVGEVHGSNEIGIVSAHLLEQLAARGLVNEVAMELPMDLSDALQRYVSTGADRVASAMMRGFATNFFGSTLVQKARELKERGIALRVIAVDVPMSPDIAVRGLDEVGAKLTAQKENALATLPRTWSQPPSTTDLAAVNAYFDHVIAEKAAICSELDASDCDRFVAMTHALWASIVSYQGAGDQQLWFARREEVIYYNLHSRMRAPTDRMFLHMGAAHTNKNSWSAGSRMAQEYAPTKGQVFSVAPAYGEGSVIWYGQEVPLPSDPLTIAEALTASPPHPLFVPTQRPTAACQANPLGAERDGFEGLGTRGESYDGYLHYGVLTQEQKPAATTMSKDDAVIADALQAFTARVRRNEREALRAGPARLRALRGR